MAPVVDAMKNVKDLARRTDDNNGSDMTVKRRGVRNSPKSCIFAPMVFVTHSKSCIFAPTMSANLIPEWWSKTQTITLVHMDHNIPDWWFKPLHWYIWTTTYQPEMSSCHVINLRYHGGF